MAIMSKPTGNPSPSIIEDLSNRLATNVSRDPEALLQAMSESERNVVLHVVKQIDQLSRVSGASPAAILNQYFPHMGMEQPNVSFRQDRRRSSTIRPSSKVTIRSAKSRMRLS